MKRRPVACPASCQVHRSPIVLGESKERKPRIVSHQSLETWPPTGRILDRVKAAYEGAKTAFGKLDLGVDLDAEEDARLLSVVAQTLAEKSGFDRESTGAALCHLREDVHPEVLDRVAGAAGVVRPEVLDSVRRLLLAAEVSYRRDASVAVIATVDVWTRSEAGRFARSRTSVSLPWEALPADVRAEFLSGDLDEVAYQFLDSKDSV